MWVVPDIRDLVLNMFGVDSRALSHQNSAHTCLTKTDHKHFQQWEHKM